MTIVATSHLVSHRLVLAGKLQEQRWKVELENRFKLVIFCECYFHFNLAHKLQLSVFCGCRHLDVGRVGLIQCITFEVAEEKGA